MRSFWKAILRELQGRLVAGAISGTLCFLYLLTTGSGFREALLFSVAAALVFALMA